MSSQARGLTWTLRRILLGSLRRRFIRVVLGMVLAVGAWAGAATPALAASSTFGYSSAYQYFTVPSGVNSVHFDVVGGSGANGQGTYGGGRGGSGAEVTGDYPVAPGWVLKIWAGGAGQPGGGDGYGNPSHDDFDGGSGGSGYGIATGNGGGGGAASYVKLPSGDIAVLAGGGGGGGGGGGAGTSTGSASNGGYYGGTLLSNGWDGEAHSGDSSSASGGLRDATKSNNGVDGGGGDPGGGGGGGGGGYETCTTGANSPTGVYCFSAGGGGQGAADSGGGGGGAGGNSYAKASATGVSFTSSGASPSTAGRVTLSYGTASATTASSSSATSPLGQSVRFTADVNPSDGGGTVTFDSDGTVIPGCSNLSFEAGGGTEWLTSCSTSSLPAGAHTITATYSGDGNYISSSASTTETVQQATSSTSLSASPASSSSGQSVTFNASVDPSDGGGDVTFRSDGLLIPGCTSLPLSAGSGTARTVSCSTSSLSVGPHTITATYDGDGNYTGSSASTTETVQWVTKTSLKASPSSLPIAGLDKLTATIAPSDGGGTVAFTQNGVPLSGCGAVSLVPAGGAFQAVCKHAWSAPGTFPILASYSGDTGYAASLAAATVTVTPAPIVSSVSPKIGSTAGGQTVTITGTRLLGVTQVHFAAALATNVTVVSDSEVTATVPAHAAGTVNVTVTSGWGTSASTSTDRYTYDPVPTVSSLAPATGTKGTVVTVTGTGFVSGVKVAFGTSPASKVVRVSSTQLRATAPAGSGTVPVSVTTPGGASATSPADQFTYTAS